MNRIFRSKPTGFYIDVGAHDPVALSVTKFFYDLGWRGINIEPVPASIYNFKEQRPRDINLNVGVSDRHDVVPLYEVVDHPELTSLDRDIAIRASRLVGTSVKEYFVEVRTLSEICERHCDTFIDFIKIDVEGGEKDVLVGADFEKFRPTMLAVEATVPCSGAIEDWDMVEEYANWHDWERLLSDAGYLLVYYDGLNRYYLREEDKHLKTRFSIPVSLLQDNFTLYREIREQERLTKEAADLKGRVSDLEAAGRRLETEKEGLVAEVEVQRREKAFLEGEAAELKGCMTELEAAQQQLEAAQQQLEGEKEGLVAEIASLGVQQDHLKKEKKRLQRRNRYLIKKRTEQQQHLALLKEEQAGLLEQIDVIEEERQQLTRELTRTHTLISELSNKVTVLEKAQHLLREDLEGVEEQFRAADEDVRVLRAILREERYLAKRNFLQRLFSPYGRSLQKEITASSVHPRSEGERLRTANERAEEERAERIPLIPEAPTVPSQTPKLEVFDPALDLLNGEPERANGSAQPEYAVSETLQETLNGDLNTSEAELANQRDLLQQLERHLETGRAYREALSRRLEVYQADLVAQQEVHKTLQQRTASQIRKGQTYRQRLSNLLADESHMQRALQSRIRQGGVYGLLRPMERLIWPVYRLARRVTRTREPDSSAPLKSEAGPMTTHPAGEGVQAAITTPLVEALVEARSVPGSLPEHTLAALFDVGEDLRQVLALQSMPESLQALRMLRGAGVKCTSLGNAQVQEGSVNGAAGGSEGLGDWLLTHGPVERACYDGVLLETKIDDATLHLLKGRLWPGTRIMILGDWMGQDPRFASWGEPSRVWDGLTLYDAPPEGWLDPVQEDSSLYECDQWPEKPRRISLPPDLPSGRPWPKISVVTVTLNQGAYLEETIQSVLGQGYPNLEYIVLDGGSTDNTPEILDRYRASLAYCVSEPDGGQSDALNKGFSMATGDILAWLNSDDRYMPDTLLRVALAFDAYTTDMVVGRCALFRDAEQGVFQVHRTALPIGEITPLPLSKLLDIDGAWLKGDFFYQPEVFWTHELWKRCGGKVNPDLFYSMDYDLWVRMAEHGACIVHIPEVLAQYRMHEAQKTSGDEMPYVPELRRVSEAHWKRLRG
ncbi:MAG: FkbM family methyltransferase [Rhodothermales bacterium]